MPFGEKYTIHHVVPDNVTNDMEICIRSNKQTIEVRIDGKLIYKEEETELEGGVGVLVPLKEEYRGKTITITTHTNIRAMNGQVKRITYGTQTGIAYDIFLRNGYKVVFACIAMLVSITGVVLSVFVYRNYDKEKRILSLLLLGFLASLWLLNESTMMQFFTNNYVFATQIQYLCVQLIPLPMLIFIKENRAYKKSHNINVVFGINCMGIILTWILVLCFKYSFYELLWITHLGYALMAGAVLYNLYRLYQKERNTFTLNMILIVVLVIGGYGAEMYNFYLSRVTSIGNISSAIFIIILLTLLGDAVRWIRTMISQSIDYKALEIIAYTDNLTKANNRNTYIMRLRALNQKRDQYDKIRMVFFDLNYLKIINDNYGHVTGDEALCKGYQCISQSFSRLGECYRIGGDEFICIICNVNVKDFITALQDFQIRLCSINATMPYEFGIAFGYSDYIKGQKEDLYELVKQADEKMYQRKMAAKESLNVCDRANHCDSEEC